MAGEEGSAQELSHCTLRAALGKPSGSSRLGLALAEQQLSFSFCFSVELPAVLSSLAAQGTVALWHMANTGHCSPLAHGTAGTGSYALLNRLLVPSLLPGQLLNLCSCKAGEWPGEPPTSLCWGQSTPDHPLQHQECCCPHSCFPARGPLDVPHCLFVVRLPWCRGPAGM